MSISPDVFDSAFENSSYAGKIAPISEQLRVSEIIAVLDKSLSAMEASSKTASRSLYVAIAALVVSAISLTIAVVMMIHAFGLI